MPRGRKKKEDFSILLPTPPLPPFTAEELKLPVLPFPLPEVPKPKTDIEINDEHSFVEQDYTPLLDAPPVKVSKIKTITIKKPEIEKWWTTLFYGPRGSGKTLHQAKIVLSILEYLKKLYKANPHLKPAIVFSVQKFSEKIEKEYLGTYLYYWRDAKDLRYCPRKNCWKSDTRHRLHGCYLIFDDMATILPADGWSQTPIWMRKMFAQARHFGIRIVANLQDPFSVDINFRRYVDMCYRFRKVIGSKDPDETKPPVKRIWGVYHRRKIKAEWLWKFGDMIDEEIIKMRSKEKIKEKVTGEAPAYKDLWKGSFHLITKKVCSIYDTTQDVPEYKPTAYEHEEIGCSDPKHPDCGYKKVFHQLV